MFNLNLPQTSVRSFPFLHIPVQPTSSRLLTSIIYIRTTVLCLWGIKCALMADRWAACLKEKEGEGERYGEVQGGGEWKSIIYTACLAIHPELQVISSLPTPPPLPPGTPPVLSAENDYRVENVDDVGLQLDKTPDGNWQTTHAEIKPTHPPCWFPSHFSVDHHSHGNTPSEK